MKKLLTTFFCSDKSQAPELLLSALFFVYLGIYFLIPYKPWTSPISFHTPFLLLGLAALGLRALLQKFPLAAIFSEEIPFFLLMAAFFLISALFIHSDKFSIGSFQAYTVSFLCFIFVRFTARHINLELLYAWINIYLIASAILILLQVNFAGIFYVSGHFGHYGFGLTSQGWGFSNWSTLGGGIMAWFLTVATARYSFPSEIKKTGFSEAAYLCAIGLGTVGLFYTVCRSAWVGYIMASGCVLIVLHLAKCSKRNFSRAVLASMLFMAVFAVFLTPEVCGKKDKLNFFAQFVSAPKSAVTHDASVNTRAQTWGLALDAIKNSPVWGIGLDQFPVLYRQAYPQLIKASSGMIDLNRDIDPHNSYLYYAVELGLLPAFFLFLLIARILFSGIRNGIVSEAYPFLMGIIAVCFWVFTNDFMEQRIFWIVLALGAGLPALKRR